MVVRSCILISACLLFISSHVVSGRRAQNRRRGSRIIEDVQQKQEQESWMPLRADEDVEAVALEFSNPYQSGQEPISGKDVQGGGGGRSRFSKQLRLRGECVINYDAVSSRHHHPLIVRPDNAGFLYPSLEGKTRIIRLSSRKRIIVSCPGDKNSLLLGDHPRIYISCRSGSLYYGRKVVLWSQLGCRRKPRPTLKRGTKACGTSAPSSSSVRGRMHSIHWPIRRGSDINQIDLCFDEERETVLFTHHLLHGSNIAAKIVDVDRPSFKRENLFTVRANTVYSKREQKSLFLLLLQDPSHLTGKRQHFLARGHLAPDSDFILEPEQDATYYYANVVPQWQAVNNGNWKSLENSVRELAESRHRTLEIWTGMHDTLHLPSSEGSYVDLFLGLSESKKVIPIPALLWKVIYDPHAKSAVAIVMVNDVRGKGRGLLVPNIYEAPCHDVCSEVTWVDWDVRDISSGRTFCCSVRDLRETIPYIPKLGRVGLLTQ